MKALHPDPSSSSLTSPGPILRPAFRDRLHIMVLATVLLMLTGISTPAQTYLIDFGGGNTTTHGPSPDDPNNYWNNVDLTLGATSDGVLSNLVSSLNSTSSISLVMISRFNGNNENGTTASGAYPVDATRDSLYGNTEIWNELTNIFPSFKLTGLDAGTKYTLMFYASRTGVGDNRETGYTITGGNSGFAALDPVNNLYNTVTIADITPDGAGEIRIDLAPTENNNNGTHFTYLGVLQIDIPPQPPLAFTLQPVSQKVVQLKPVTFTCAVSGPPPYFIQWYENSSPIFDANQFSYTIPSVELYMDGYQYSVTVSNLTSAIAGTNAVLTVLSDTNPPTLLQAASYDGNTIELTFNESIDPTTGSSVDNYVVNNGAVDTWGATPSTDGKTVILYVSAPLVGIFSVKVSNVQDTAGNPIAPNTTITGEVVPIESQDLLFDFGGGNQTQYGVDDPVNYWNNVNVGTTDMGEMFNLVTVHNITTPLGLYIISRFNGVNENGTLSSTVFPSQATRDSYFGNTENFGAGSNFFPSFKLTGMDLARQYTLTFYASRTGVGDNRETGYTVQGANSGFAALNPANNINNITKVEGITPDASGEITVSIGPTPNNNNGNHFTYLGVMRLSPYSPPLAFLPPAVADGKIRLEWTGTGQLLRASSLSGPWDPVVPAPSSSYEENLVPGENRFFRLQE